MVFNGEDRADERSEAIGHDNSRREAKSLWPITKAPLTAAALPERWRTEVLRDAHKV